MHDWASTAEFREHDNAIEKFLLPAQDLCRKTYPDHNATSLLHLINNSLFALENVFEIKGVAKNSIDDKADKLEKILEHLDQFQRHFLE